MPCVTKNDVHQQAKNIFSKIVEVTNERDRPALFQGMENLLEAVDDFVCEWAYDGLSDEYERLVSDLKERYIADDGTPYANERLATVEEAIEASLPAGATTTEKIATLNDMVRGGEERLEAMREYRDRLARDFTTKA